MKGIDINCAHRLLGPPIPHTASGTCPDAEPMNDYFSVTTSRIAGLPTVAYELDCSVLRCCFVPFRQVPANVHRVYLSSAGRGR
jgi:hypothetical protein